MTSRRLLFAALALVLLGAAGAGGLYWWRRETGTYPQPPALDLEGEHDPALAAAVGQARQGVLYEPRSAEAWGRLGKVFLANGYRDEAIPCFKEAARLAPGKARWPYFEGLAQRLNNLDAAVRCFGEAAWLAGRTGPESFTIRLRYGEALLGAGRADEARSLLRELLRQEPDNPRVRLALGALAADDNDVETALSYLLPCADNPLTRQRAAAHLARVYLLKHDPAAAERYRRRARRLPRDPEPPDSFVEEYSALMVGRHALFLRAESYLSAGEVQKAMELLQSLAAAHPDEVEAHVKLGMALDQLGRYAQAEAVLRRGLATNPDKVQAHYFLCVAMFHQAERSGARPGFDAAAEEARRTLSRKPDHPYAHLYLGLALRKLGRPEAALAELRQAVRFSPESTDPHLHLGVALLEAGRREEGMAHLKKAATFAGEDDPRPREALKKWQKPGRKEPQ